MKMGSPKMVRKPKKKKEQASMATSQRTQAAVQ
jgi:hypothetical protein